MLLSLDFHVDIIIIIVVMMSSSCCRISKHRPVSQKGELFWLWTFVIGLRFMSICNYFQLFRLGIKYRRKGSICIWQIQNDFLRSIWCEKRLQYCNFKTSKYAEVLPNFKITISSEHHRFELIFADSTERNRRERERERKRNRIHRKQ